MGHLEKVNESSNHQEGPKMKEMKEDTVEQQGRSRAPQGGRIEMKNEGKSPTFNLNSLGGILNCITSSTKERRGGGRGGERGFHVQNQNLG